MTTVNESLSATDRALIEAHREEARVLAEWLVCAASGLNRSELLIHGDCELGFAALARLGEWTKRVASGEPLQYVLGSTSFFGREFLCDRRALIPRPETEELCDRVLSDSAIWRDAAPSVMDVGTGTGCIAITLVLEHPNARVIAVDCSVEALDLARKNARRLGAESRIEWRRADLLAGVPPNSLCAIVSNPPYVSESELAALAPEVRDYEPHLALAAGADGLSVIRRLAQQAGVALAPGGKLWVEIGNEQGPAVCDLLRAQGFLGVTVHRDLAGRDRMVEARKAE